MIHWSARLRAFLLGLSALLVGLPAHAVLPIEHWTTPTGARVLFVNAPGIPMLDVAVAFDAGASRDPAGRSGVASFTNALMARGVTGLDEAAIAERFASLGAERGGGAGDDRATLSLRTLTSPAELQVSLELFERILATPTFPAEVLERERQRSIQSLREAMTRPDHLAQRAFGKALYGDHPYGRSSSVESVAQITRDDLLSFWSSHYSAPRAVVAPIGAISRAQAEEIARLLTARLPAGGAVTPLEAVTPLTRATVERIEHSSAQSHILLGAPAIAWGDPDQFPLLVGNHVLGGGGFVSRLYGEVREKRGLAYSVYSYFALSRAAGPFTIGLQTRRDQTEVALEVVRETLARFLREGPSAEELAAAKANLTGGFALRIDSNRKILDQLLSIGVNRLPLDYLERWVDRVNAVTLEQVRDAFARRVRLDALATVVVGAPPPPAKP
jgi:zinc protease